MSVFVNQGDPVKIFIRPCKSKAALSKKVTENGGMVVGMRNKADYTLYVPGDIVSDNNHISSVFIDDCINSGKLLDAKSYRYAVRKDKDDRNTVVSSTQEVPVVVDMTDDVIRVPKSAPSTSSWRAPYTQKEDMLIIREVYKLSKKLSINGSNLWEQLAARRILSRSSQSMKERFIKKILPFIDRYDLSERELKRFRQLGSAKAERIAAPISSHATKLPLTSSSPGKPLSVAPPSQPLQPPQPPQQHDPHSQTDTDDGANTTITSRLRQMISQIPMRDKPEGGSASESTDYNGKSNQLSKRENCEEKADKEPTTSKPPVVTIESSEASQPDSSGSVRVLISDSSQEKPAGSSGTVDGEADSNEKVEAAIDCDEPGLSKEGSSTAEICRSSIVVKPCMSPVSSPVSTLEILDGLDELKKSTHRVNRGQLLSDSDSDLEVVQLSKIVRLSSVSPQAKIPVAMIDQASVTNEGHKEMPAANVGQDEPPGDTKYQEEMPAPTSSNENGMSAHTVSHEETPADTVDQEEMPSAPPSSETKQIGCVGLSSAEYAAGQESVVDLEFQFTDSQSATPTVLLKADDPAESLIDPWPFNSQSSEIPEDLNINNNQGLSQTPAVYDCTEPARQASEEGMTQWTELSSGAFVTSQPLSDGKVSTEVSPGSYYPTKDRHKPSDHTKDGFTPMCSDERSKDGFTPMCSGDLITPVREVAGKRLVNVQESGDWDRMEMGELITPTPPEDAPCSPPSPEIFTGKPDVVVISSSEGETPNRDRALKTTPNQNSLTTPELIILSDTPTRKERNNLGESASVVDRQTQYQDCVDAIVPPSPPSPVEFFDAMDEVSPADESPVVNPPKLLSEKSPTVISQHDFPAYDTTATSHPSHSQTSLSTKRAPMVNTSLTVVSQHDFTSYDSPVSKKSKPSPFNIVHDKPVRFTAKSPSSRIGTFSQADMRQNDNCSQDRMPLTTLSNGQNVSPNTEKESLGPDNPSISNPLNEPNGVVRVNLGNSQGFGQRTSPRKKTPKKIGPHCSTSACDALMPESEHTPTKRKLVELCLPKTSQDGSVHVEEWLHSQTSQKSNRGSQSPEDTMTGAIFRRHPMFTELSSQYAIDDETMMTYVCVFSGDFIKLKQYLGSDGKYGNFWTKAHDKLLLDSSLHRSKSRALLRRQFSSQEIQRREHFLLNHVVLSDTDRSILLTYTKRYNEHEPIISPL